MMNILARQPGKPGAVYVRCRKCRRLVARYKLSEYYHHGKGIESFLKSLGPGAGDSARHFIEEFERAKQESLDGFEEAVKLLKKAGKDID
jgi:hypothetical protein